jgi:hypothetical protein
MTAAVMVSDVGWYSSASTSLAAPATKMVLWTNDPLAAARHLYLEAGFQLADEEPHHSFGVDLVGQNYKLDLTRSRPLC